MTSPECVSVPHTWRPLGVRVVGAVAGLALVAVVAAVWIGFSNDVRAQFSLLQIITLILLGLLAFSVLFALMRCRVSASENELLIVNGYRYYRLEWAQVVAVSLRRGAPWASIDLSDGSTISAMGIQSADGARGIAAARELKELAAQKSAPEPD